MAITTTRMLRIHLLVKFLSCKRKMGDIHDTFAVAIKKYGTIPLR